jgi:hypothetical protein
MKEFLPQLKEELYNSSEREVSSRYGFRILFSKKQKEEAVHNQIKEKLQKVRDPLLRFKPGQIVWSNTINSLVKIDEILYELNPYGEDPDYSGFMYTMNLKKGGKVDLIDNEKLLSYSEFLDFRMILVEKERERILRLYDQLFEMEKT